MPIKRKITPPQTAERPPEMRAAAPIQGEEMQRRLLTPDDAASKLGVTHKLLERWRATGEGPAFVRLSRKTIRYREQDLVEFVAGRVRANSAAA